MDLNPKPVDNSLQKSEAEGILASASLKWLGYRVPTGLFWLWLLGQIGIFDLENVSGFSSWGFIPIALVQIWFFIARHWFRAFTLPIYVASFPVIVFLIPFVYFLTGIKTTEGATRPKWIRTGVFIFDFARSGRAVVLLLGVIVTCWSVVGFSPEYKYRHLFAFAAHVCTYILFLQVFRWAANPYKPLISVLGFAATRGRKLVHKIFIEPSFAKELQERRPSLETCDFMLRHLERFYRPEAPLQRGLTSYTHGKLSSIFTAVYVLIYIVIAVSFSAALLQIERSPIGKLVSGLGELPNFATYFYFSFLSQATSIPDGVQPTSVAGQFWIIWLVATGLLTLTGLITLFTTSASTHSNSSLAQIKKLVEESKQSVLEWKSELESRPKATT